MNIEAGAILDEETHTYTRDAKQKNSVSSVLNFFLPMSDFIPDDALSLGRVRHAWFHEIVQGYKLENEPDPRIAGQIAACRLFMEQVRPAFVFGEVPLYDPILDICGKPDLIAKIAGRMSVLDFKPPTKSKRTRLQTAAYRIMVNRSDIPGVAILDRYELRFHDDGKYRLEKHEDPDDEKRFGLMVQAFRAATHYK